MTTYSARAAEIDSRWYVIDAQGQVLGRLATRIATILRGKHKPTFTPNLRCGDFVIVVNAAKIAVTGNRLDSKLYYRHSGYPGGLKVQTLRQLMEKHPDRAIQEAVKGMLPQNKMRDHLLRRLKIYSGPDHPHAAQQPELWSDPTPETFNDIVREEPEPRARFTARDEDRDGLDENDEAEMEEGTTEEEEEE
jgi:large subunit ribosomal protein L13